MSNPVSSEQLACFRDDARRLAGRAADHEDDLEALVRASEADVHEVEAALFQALDGRGSGAAALRQVYSAQLRRSTASAEAARRACVSAREQHVTACRLLSRIDDDAREPATPARAGVLVVDDFEDVREMIAQVLQDAGFVVRTAVNGLEALIAAYEMQPAVILMDMTMPVLDGIEATRLIKATEATRRARVIAYTADPSLADVGVQKMFVAVVPKPSTPDVVLAAVRNVARA